MNEFSHIDESGKARMVDVGHKNEQLRIAVNLTYIRRATEHLTWLK